MIAFVEGVQLSGKSTLIENTNLKHIKFNFSKYSLLFNIEDIKSLRTFQIGKDMSMLYMLQFLNKKRKILLIDRGPISSLYYSILLNRFNEDDIKHYINELAKYNYTYWFIYPVNKDANNKEENIRNKNDNFNDLNKEVNDEVLNKIKNLCLENGIKFYIYYKYFNKSIKYNSKHFEKNLKLIMKEKGI